MGFESLQARRSDSPHDLRKQLHEGRSPQGERPFSVSRTGPNTLRHVAVASGRLQTRAPTASPLLRDRSGTETVPWCHLETITHTSTPTTTAADTLLLTLDEAARELRCARRSVERQIARHRLTVVHLGRSVRVERRELTSTLYRGADGNGHARVTMGRRPDGTIDRRHVQRRTKTELRDAVRELEHRRDTEGYTWTQGDPTLGDWLEHWLGAVLPMTVRWKTLSTYPSQMRLHVLPALGNWRMSEIQPEHLEEHYRRMQTDGHSTHTIRAVHRVLRSALNEAVRRRRLASNPALIARPPRGEDVELDPFVHGMPTAEQGTQFRRTQPDRECKRGMALQGSRVWHRATAGAPGGGRAEDELRAGGPTVVRCALS